MDFPPACLSQIPAPILAQKRAGNSAENVCAVHDELIAVLYSGREHQAKMRSASFASKFSTAARGLARGNKSVGDELVYFSMADSRSATKPFQFLVKPLVLLPFGHHWTLPRPKMSVPSKSSPERTSRDKELLVFLLVNSTVET
jgi:hypothetical protein